MIFRLRKNRTIILQFGFSGQSIFGVSGLFPEVHKLANKTVVALPGSSVPVQFVLGALLDPDGGPGFMRFFNIVAHVYSCQRRNEFTMVPENFSEKLPAGPACTLR